MMTEELIVAKNAKTRQGEQLRIGYYLLTEKVEHPDMPLHIGYGVKIILKRENGVVEERTMSDLSCYKLSVLTLIQLLSTHEVLPIAMEETVLDYLEAHDLCV